MHKEAIKKLANQLKEISKETEILHKGSSIECLAYKLEDPVEAKYRNVVDTILRNKNFGEKFSSKYISRKLDSVFQELLYYGDNGIEVKLEELIDEFYSYEQENHVYLKVDGVHTNLCFKLGNVWFSPGDETLIEYIRSNSSRIIETLKNSDIEKQYFRDLVSQQLESELSGGCVGIVPVQAEPQRALEKAKEEVRRSIDLLRFSSKVIYPISEDIRIGLKGDHPKLTREGFILSTSSFHQNSEPVGSVISLNINHETIQSIDKIGAYKISNALQQKQTSNFEDSLIRSIHWFSIALTQDEHGNAFLFLIVALESLFKSHHGNSVASNIAESTALLVSTEFEDRKWIVDTLRTYYGKRSGVTHGGKKLITDSELFTLMHITKMAILSAIGKISEFDSQSQFMDWLEKIKLS